MSKRIFRAIDVFAFGALLVAGMLIAAGLAHSQTEAQAGSAKADRATLVASAAEAVKMVTVAETDIANGTTVLTRVPATTLAF